MTAIANRNYPSQLYDNLLDELRREMEESKKHRAEMDELIHKVDQTVSTIIDNHKLDLKL